jgi:hypothetical protein
MSGQRFEARAPDTQSQRSEVVAENLPHALSQYLFGKQHLQHLGLDILTRIHLREQVPEISVDAFPTGPKRSGNSGRRSLTSGDSRSARP